MWKVWPLPYPSLQLQAHVPVGKFSEVAAVVCLLSCSACAELLQGLLVVYTLYIYFFFFYLIIALQSL